MDIKTEKTLLGFGDGCRTATAKVGKQMQPTKPATR